MKQWWSSFLDLIYPEEPPPAELPVLEEPFCEMCGKVFEGEITGEFTCSNCLDRTWRLKAARAPYRSKEFVRDVIHDFKFNGQFHRLKLMGEWLTEGYHRFYADHEIDALVPVPLHPFRMWWRGFNQAHELALFLHKQTRLPLCNCLKRTRYTKIQSRLDRDERLKNQRKAYQVRRGFDLKGKTLLVIDDVFTTGATVDSCAGVLKKAGAREVYALTVARG